MNAREFFFVHVFIKLAVVSWVGGEKVIWQTALNMNVKITTFSQKSQF